MANQQKEFQHPISDAYSFVREVNQSRRNRNVLIVDVHAHWCGPCRAMVPMFQRLFLDYMDYGIKFLVVDVEKLLESTAESAGDEKGNSGSGKSTTTSSSTSATSTSSTSSSSSSSTGGAGDDSQFHRDEILGTITKRAGRSKPFFVIYQDGAVTFSIEGAQAPKINDAIRGIMEAVRRVRDAEQNEAGSGGGIGSGIGNSSSNSGSGSSNSTAAGVANSSSASASSSASSSAAASGSSASNGAAGGGGGGSANDEKNGADDASESEQTDA